jgi:hypothetical protein
VSGKAAIPVIVGWVQPTRSRAGWDQWILPTLHINRCGFDLVQSHLTRYSMLTATGEAMKRVSEESTMPEKLISDLIDLPDRVRKGDFVLNSSKDIAESISQTISYSYDKGNPALSSCFSITMALAVNS